MEIGSHDAGDMPDYTNPADMSRLRPVFSGRGWSADRDDPDPIRMTALYRRMDALLARGPEVPYAWDEGDWAALVVEIGQVWGEIRKTQRRI